MANNDYWAYLRDNNELKHYRTSIADGGSPNKGGTKGKRIVNPDGSVTYVYDDKVAAAQARGQARQQQASRAAKERLVDRGNSGGNGSNRAIYADVLSSNGRFKNVNYAIRG